MVSGCWRPAALSEPERLYSVNDELQPVRLAYQDNDLWARYLASGDRTGFRNEIITARMYAIDVNYTEYEIRLTREGAEFDVATAIANNGLTTASTLIVDPATKSVLSGAASFVGFTGTAVNEKALLKQSIQHVQAGMRQSRAEQAAIIFANLKCGAASYPLGMALSDVELYYRAGTFASGLIKVTENVANATADAKALKDSETPAQPVQARARLAANATSSDIKRGRAGCAGVGIRSSQLRTADVSPRSSRVIAGRSDPADTVRARLNVDAPGDALIRFVFPNGIVAPPDQGHAKQVTDFMAEKNIAESLAFFLRAETFIAQRAELAQRLRERGLIP